ncbi:hypothetical protein OROMI_017213 [Orobanche minor]
MNLSMRKKSLELEEEVVDRHASGKTSLRWPNLKRKYGRSSMQEFSISFYMAICKTTKNIDTPIIDEQICWGKILGFMVEIFRFPMDRGPKILGPEADPSLASRLGRACMSEGVLMAKEIHQKAGTEAAIAQKNVRIRDDPHVDFRLKLTKADLMSIRGLYRFVQSSSLVITVANVGIMENNEDADKNVEAGTNELSRAVASALVI